MSSSINNAVKSFYAQYTDFSGRATVGQYWWVQLYLFIIGIVLACLMSICNNGTFAWYFWLVVGYAWGLFNLIPGLALSVRRLHDTGRSGWWIFINLVPLVGTIIFIVWMILPGNTKGDRYGYTNL